MNGGEGIGLHIYLISLSSVEEGVGGEQGDDERLHAPVVFNISLVGVLEGFGVAEGFVAAEEEAEEVADEDLLAVDGGGEA